MAVNFDEVLKKSAFDNLEPERKAFFKKLAEDIQGKNTMEVMSIIMMHMKNMPKGRELTKDEQEAMIEAALTSLPDDEQAKLKKIFFMLK